MAVRIHAVVLGVSEGPAAQVPAYPRGRFERVFPRVLVQRARGLADPVSLVGGAKGEQEARAHPEGEKDDERLVQALENLLHRFGFDALDGLSVNFLPDRDDDRPVEPAENQTGGGTGCEGGDLVEAARLLGFVPEYPYEQSDDHPTDEVGE